MVCRVARTGGALLVAAAMLLSPPGRAQAQDGTSTPGLPPVSPPPPAPPPVAELIAPRLIDAPPPSYPASETEPAQVIATLLVGADGLVREVRSLDGKTAFAEAARAAVQLWRFEPARRSGEPVAAIVRVAVDFTPPAPAPAPRVILGADPPTPTPPNTIAEGGLGAAPLGGLNPANPAVPAPAPAPAKVEEIVVRGEKTTTPAAATMGRADIRQLPGAMGDPLRAIEVMPGVTPTVSGLPYFYTRGAPPNTMGFMLDDLQVPYLFHVGLGPSILHPAFVRSVSLEPAGGHPRYGRMVGAFVAATTQPPPDEVAWEGRLRVVDASGFVAAPFANGKAHAAVGATASYVTPLLSIFAPEYTIDYRDFATRVSYDPSPRDRITVFTLGSYDYASQRELGVEQILFASEIYRSDLKWQRRLDKGEVRAGVTVGYDRSALAAKRFSSDQSLAVRAAVRTELAPAWSVEAGADARMDAYDADLPSEYSLTRADYEETKRLFAKHTDTVTGTYGALSFRPMRRLDLMAGLRFDVYDSQARTIPALGPRTSLSYSPIDAVRLFTAHGLAHQTPAYAVPLPALALPGLPGGLQRAMQSSVGTEVAAPFKIIANATLFRSVFTNLSDFVFIQGEFPLKPAEPLRGEANGLELSLRRPVRDHVGLQLSYTLSRSTRQPERGPARLSNYDRTHVFNMAVLFDLGRGFTFGGRTLVYTGLLRDPGTNSSERLPAFFRIDLRVAKRWKWGKAGYFGVVAEGINVTGSAETIAIRCEDDVCTPRQIGPLTLPSIGIEGGM